MTRINYNSCTISDNNNVSRDSQTLKKQSILNIFLTLVTFKILTTILFFGYISHEKPIEIVIKKK